MAPARNLYLPFRFVTSRVKYFTEKIISMVKNQYETCFHILIYTTILNLVDVIDQGCQQRCS
jgi:hypothetical protein